MLRSGLSKREWAPLLGVLVLGMTLTGCPDPEAKSEEFEERLTELPQRPDAGVVEGQLVDPSGEYFTAIVLGGDTSTPILFRTTIEATLNEDGEGGTMTTSMQPVAAEMRSVPARSEVGDPLPKPAGSIEGIEISAEGAFEVDLMEQDVEADVNPISDRPIKANLKLVGTIIDEDLNCGTVEGAVTDPVEIPLTGISTFASIRIEPGSSLEGLEFEWQCPETEDGEGE